MKKLQIILFVVAGMYFTPEAVAHIRDELRSAVTTVFFKGAEPNKFVSWSLYAGLTVLSKPLTEEYLVQIPNKTKSAQIGEMIAGSCGAALGGYVMTKLIGIATGSGLSSYKDIVKSNPNSKIAGSVIGGVLGMAIGRSAANWTLGKALNANDFIKKIEEDHPELITGAFVVGTTLVLWKALNSFAG